MNEQSDWRQAFIGREAELTQLMYAWQKARAGQPQFIVYVAESGYGKTRLLQQFYTLLSRQEDPDDYWPDQFTVCDKTLDVNPTFDQGRVWGPDETPPEIPWLWWGIRFVKPGERHGEINVCGLERQIDRLQPHIQPILAARQKGALTREAVVELGAALAGFIPGAQILDGLKSVYDLLKARKQERELQQELSRDIGEREAARKQGLADLALDAFETILDPRRPDARQVPVVIVLDDAQWADTLTLDFIGKLLEGACRNGWPLLVAAAHWQREWNENEERVYSGDGAPETLTDLARRLTGHFPGWSPRVLGGVNDLSPVLREALPGLTEDQIDFVLQRTGGNPLLLQEMIQWLIRRPALFEDRDTAHPMTPNGVRQLHDIPGDIADFARDRFDVLEERMKDVLGWSSIQGIRFLHAISEAIAGAQGIQPSLTPEEVRQTLMQAEHPKAFIQNDSTGRLGEFRLVTFHEIAGRHLGLDPDSEVAVQRAVRNILGDWIRDGRLDTLPRPERLDALQLAGEQYRQAGPGDTANGDFRTWAVAVAALLEAYREDLMWDKAWQTAQSLADSMPDTGWPLDLLSFWTQIAVVDTLQEMRDLERALRVASPLRDRTRASATEEPTKESLRDVSVSLNKVADVELQIAGEERVQSALEAYRESLEIFKDIVRRYGETPYSLADLTWSLERLARHLRLDDHAAAVELASQAVSLAKRVVDTWGPTATAVADLAELQASLETIRSAGS